MYVVIAKCELECCMESLTFNIASSHSSWSSKDEIWTAWIITRLGQNLLYPETYQVDQHTFAIIFRLSANLLKIFKTSLVDNTWRSRDWQKYVDQLVNSLGAEASDQFWG